MPSLPTPAPASFAVRGRVLALCMAAAALLCPSAGFGETAQAPAAGSPVPANVQQNPPPIDPRSLSCDALKSRLKAAGQLAILSGPKGGWGDTFYGPAVPRCQFWQMPVFTYVRASDGLCGVGYICVDKLSFD